ncbi:MAG: hypothetical protein AB8C95_10730, partial [Phycisphaeraceae bacterium]
MSTIGTGIAAGVANAGNTARAQVATGNSRDAQRADSSKQTDKIIISQMQGASATRDADQDLPEGQTPGYEELYEGEAEQQEDDSANPNDQIHDGDAPLSSATNLPLQPTYGPSA